MELGASPPELEVADATPVKNGLTGPLTTLNSFLFHVSMVVACVSLAALLIVVVYGVVLR